MVGVWVALEDIDSSNGPLIYYPGSHRLPIFTNEHLGINPDLAKHWLEFGYREGRPLR
jgi:ectoine hydroxylase-related dioxygenase (phytanoyl-CoA dioxygenase family)